LELEVLNLLEATVVVVVAVVQAAAGDCWAVDAGYSHLLEELSRRIWPKY
jgi:pyruvate/2-oxoacid:ferredoxin oxidoreductase beta subunit